MEMPPMTLTTGTGKKTMLLGRQADKKQQMGIVTAPAAKQNDAARRAL
jgi:hypothetical protein